MILPSLYSLDQDIRRSEPVSGSAGRGRKGPDLAQEVRVLLRARRPVGLREETVAGSGGVHASNAAELAVMFCLSRSAFADPKQGDGACDLNPV